MYYLHLQIGNRTSPPGPPPTLQHKSGKDCYPDVADFVETIVEIDCMVDFDSDVEADPDIGLEMHAEESAGIGHCAAANAGGKAGSAAS
mmetsp:Transcript_22999/g.33637  ORF Transcript_22999/g.33637 Transcript_22999/m.33637 type:complete len:89 (-) Transcript_22999:48-314(-)